MNGFGERKLVCQATDCVKYEVGGPWPHINGVDQLFQIKWLRNTLYIRPEILIQNGSPLIFIEIA